MEKKILFVAHMDSHIANFHLPYLKWFQEQGYEVHVASNSLEQSKDIQFCDKKFQVDFERSPFTLKNIKVYYQLKKILKENKYQLIHVHTPMGGIIGRLAAKSTKTKPVLYTAHGFHFYKGSPLKNWLIYYRIEKLFSKITDELIVINKEDYEVASKKFSKNTSISYVHGVGVDLKEYYSQDEKAIQENRKKLNLTTNDFVMTYIGELNDGKNQMFLIKMMKYLVLINNNLKLLLVGYGVNTDKYKKVIEEYNLNQNVLLLGFRKDVNDLINLSDLIVSSSTREGLPRNLLEALAVGKPMLVSDVRGNHDLVKNDYNGYVFKLNDEKDFTEKLMYLINNKDLLTKFGENSYKMVQEYSLNKVLEEMKNIYNKYF